MALARLCPTQRRVLSDTDDLTLTWIRLIPAVARIGLRPMVCGMCPGSELRKLLGGTWHKAREQTRTLLMEDRSGARSRCQCSDFGDAGSTYWLRCSRHLWPSDMLMTSKK